MTEPPKKKPPLALAKQVAENLFKFKHKGSVVDLNKNQYLVADRLRKMMDGKSIMPAVALTRGIERGIERIDSIVFGLAEPLRKVNLRIEKIGPHIGYVMKEMR
jgi:hypothetical protein